MENTSMINTENNINKLLIEGKQLFGFVSLKGEMEAEGLCQIEVAREAILAAKNDLNYLIKIGGSEAKTNLQYLVNIGITSVVVPMIESSFAMQKFINMVPPNHFEHIGVTIETVTAVENIVSIIKAGTLLTEVTIGRNDLTASYGGSSVESEKTISMVKKVANEAKSKGLKVTMGGNVGKGTVESLLSDEELYDLIDYVETRKVIMSVDKFIQEGSIDHALKFELSNLERRLAIYEEMCSSDKKRKAAILSRI
jgi:4-hydroxy-2-oxoheptanedioate aldolase